MNNFLLFVAPGFIAAIVGLVVYLLCLLFGDPVPNENNPVPHCRHFSIDRTYLGERGTDEDGYTIYKCKNCDSVLAFGTGLRNGQVILLSCNEANWNVVLGVY